MSENSEVSRTLAFGETALSRLRHDQISAYPRNYELLYTYAGGFNFKLSRAIDALLAERQHLNAADIHALYETYLAPGRVEERVEEVGARVTAEIGAISQTIATALASGGEYGESLREANTELGAAKDAETLGAIAARLAAATAKVERENRRLEAKLIASREEMEKLKTNLESIRHESLTDPLTTLFNRKHFDQSLERAALEAEREARPLALLMIDVDLFKRINDTYGHQTGDQVLRLVGISIRQSVKSGDIACRYGGEEFAIILPQTPIAIAATIAERIRQAVMARDVVKRSTNQNLGRVSVSIGVAAYTTAGGPQGLVEQADMRLYAAKRAGRNRVVCTDAPEEEVERVA